MNPMKLTGIVLLILGTLIAGFAVVSLMPSGDNATVATPSIRTPSAVPSAALLFPFAGVALAAGLVILMFGGKGVIRTRNPAVRN